MSTTSRILRTAAFAGLAAIALVSPRADAARSAAGDAPAHSFVLRAGVLYPGDGPPQIDALVIVRDGRIEFVKPGDSELPADLPVVDRRDAVVAPGFVLAESALSDAFDEQSKGFQFGTIVTFRAVDPLRRAIDGFSFTQRLDSVLATGVTTAYLAPGRERVVNGRGAVVKTAGRSADTRTLRNVSDLSLSLGNSPTNPPGRFTPPLPPSAENPLAPGVPQMPRSRAGAAFALWQALDAAADYARAWRGAALPKQRPEFEPEWLALAELVASKTPVRIRTDASPDVAAALDFLQESGLAGALVGGAEAEDHARRLRDAKTGVIVEVRAVSGGVPDVDPVRVEPPRSTARTAAALAEAGVPVALIPAGDAIGDLALVLSSVVEAGMTREAALRAVTSDAAKMLGVADRVGSLAPGRHADFVVLNGPPGDATTAVRETWIEGERVFDRDAARASRREYLETTKRMKVEPSRGGSLVVRAGLVLPVSGDPIRNGSVAIHDGRIVGVGHDVAVPPGARVIDAGPDAVVTPGLLDARSFLGLGPSKGAFSGTARLEHLAVPDHPDFAWVASGGVTTVLLQSPNYAGSGSPIAALKTGGAWSEAVVRETCGVGIPGMGSNADGYRALLKRGQQYSEKWDKYFVDSDAEKAAAKKAKADGKVDEAAKKDDKAKTEKPGNGDEESEKPVEDPITGTWEGQLSGGPLPGPQPFTLRLRLRGTSVSGSIESRVAGRDEQSFEGGKFENGTLSITITRPEIPFPLVIEGKIDRPDHMTGSIDARVIKLEFEATRTEKVAPTLTAKPKGKKGLEMPPVDENLEPFRRVFHGDAAIVVATDSSEDIETAISVIVDEFKLPLVILRGSGAASVAQKMAEKKVGLLTGPDFPAPEHRLGLPVPTVLANAGAAVAIGSSAGTGGRELRAIGVYATSEGIGGDQVLRALTLDAARMFQIDGRVGHLAPERDGDLVIWSGLPFRGGTRVRTVVVGGSVVYDASEDSR